jgi:integrase
MLGKLPERARAVCALVAFTGFTRSELMGLKWADYDTEFIISIQREIWNGEEGAPKTEAREAGVFVVPLLREILKNYKKAYPAGKADWIFRGQKLLRRLIWIICQGETLRSTSMAWFGWHAFSTRARPSERTGVDAKEIQSILRHADISTTMAFCVLPDHKRAKAGLKKLEQVAKNKYGINAKT